MQAEGSSAAEGAGVPLLEGQQERGEGPPPRKSRGTSKLLLATVLFVAVGVVWLEAGASCGTGRRGDR